MKVNFENLQLWKEFLYFVGGKYLDTQEIG